LAADNKPAIALVGAGIAGLSAAARLRELGLRVRVLEKSRGLGGRSATRRIGRLGFDHGAQYLTVREPALEKALAPLIQREIVALWKPRVVRLAPDGARSPGKEGRRFVGVPGMSTSAAASGASQSSPLVPASLEWLFVRMGPGPCAGNRATNTVRLLA